MSFSKVSDNYYYLHRPGFNPSSRATYTIFHPSIINFYTTMSVGRALLLNPVKHKINEVLYFWVEKKVFEQLKLCHSE